MVSLDTKSPSARQHGSKSDTVERCDGGRARGTEEGTGTQAAERLGSKVDESGSQPLVEVT
jgi:hypothetical protein